MVRDFLYYDRLKIEHYISELDEGLVKSKREVTEVQSKKGSVDAGLFKGETGSSIKTVEELKELTDSTLFTKLENLLENKKEKIVHFPKTGGYNIDETIRELKRGTLIHVEGTFETSFLDRLFNMMLNFLPLIASGYITTTSPNPKNLKFLETITSKYISLKIKSTDPIDITFITTLNKGLLLTEIEKLNGKYEIFGRIKTILQKSETIKLYNLIENINLPEESINQFLSTMTNNPMTPMTLPMFGINKVPTINDFTIAYPAIEIEPIAIYW